MDEEADRLRTVNSHYRKAEMEYERATRARAIAVLEAHARGMSYKEIGAALGCGGPRAVRIAQKGAKYI